MLYIGPYLWLILITPCIDAIQKYFLNNLNDYLTIYFVSIFILQDLLPELHKHFNAQGFHTSMYASSWFLTLFAVILPISLSCRIMDVFISEVRYYRVPQIKYPIGLCSTHPCIPKTCPIASPPLVVLVAHQVFAFWVGNCQKLEVAPFKTCVPTSSQLIAYPVAHRFTTSAHRL